MSHWNVGSPETSHEWPTKGWQNSHGKHLEQGQSEYYLLSMNEFGVRRCLAGGILQNEATRCPPQGRLVKCILSGWLSIFSFSKKTNLLPQQCTCNTLYMCWKKRKNFVVKVWEKRAALFPALLSALLLCLGNLAWIPASARLSLQESCSLWSREAPLVCGGTQ